MGASALRKAEAHFKQLCSLGVESTVLMPTLFKSLRELVPYSYCGFYWADENREIANYYWEGDGDLEIILEYVVEFHRTGREQEVLMTLPEALSVLPTFSPAERLIKISRREFERHDFYNLCWRPMRMWDCRFVMVREGPRSLGALLVSRDKNQTPFTPDEEQVLERLAPYLAHACAATTPFDGPWQDTEDSGLAILKTNGEIQHISPSARALLFYASHPVISARTIGRRPHEEEASTLIKRLYEDLVGVFHDRDAAKVPMRRIRNAWGSFTLRAYWLDPGRRDGEALIGVTVQRQEPLPLSLARRLADMPLSPRQKEICLALAEEKSYGAIAEKLGLSERTVISHLQNIHDKLETRSRTELMRKLLAG